MTETRTMTRTRILKGNGPTPSVQPSRASVALWDFSTSADSPFLVYNLEVIMHQNEKNVAKISL